jgi:hypothetical protein
MSLFDSFGSGINLGAPASTGFNFGGSIIDPGAASIGVGQSTSVGSGPSSGSSGSGFWGSISGGINWLEHTAITDFNKITSGVKLPTVQTKVSVNPVVWIAAGVVLLFAFFLFKKPRRA